MEIIEESLIKEFYNRLGRVKGNQRKRAHSQGVAAGTTPGGRGLGEDHSAGRRECAEWMPRSYRLVPG